MNKILLNQWKGHFWLAAIWLGMGWVVSVPAQQTDNCELRAVPVPGKVVMDGKLNDWDLSGEIVMCDDLGALLQTYAVRAAAMYDATNLYLSFRFKDATPMVNHIDPLQDPGGGWKADGVELRIQTDQIVNIEAWYFTERNSPTMWIGYGIAEKWEAEIKEALKQGAQMAFSKDADGKGYVQEMAIPWKLISKSGQPMQAGGQMRMGIQANWGTPSGRNFPMYRIADLINPAHPNRSFFWNDPDAWGQIVFLAQGRVPVSPSVTQLSAVARYQQLLYSTEGPVKIAYQMPRDGYVTLVIEKPDGTRVRNLIADYARKAGKNEDYWDGTDDNGRLVSPGDYQVRGLTHEEFDLRYQFCYGNPGNPQWQSSNFRGGWLSNHCPPLDVCADEKQIYLACENAEGSTSLMAADYQGQRQWGIGGRSGGMLARQGKYLFALAGGSMFHFPVPVNEVHVVRIDPSTGKFAPFADGKSSHKIAAIPKLKDWPRKPHQPEGMTVAAKGYDAEWCWRQSMGLAATADKLYAALFYENKIVEIDPEKGEAIREIPLKRPCGLAVNRAGVLYAISGKQVVRLAPDGAATPIIADRLDAPMDLATDAQGNLYVSDWGAAMCVKVFSPAGKLLRIIGKAGGRPLNGTYDPNGMFRPFGVAVDGDNRLWVAECDDAPRRISVWDAATGRFLKEYCGTSFYAAVGCRIDPTNPRQALVMGNNVELDWAKGLWRVTGTLSRPEHPDALLTLAPSVVAAGLPNLFVYEWKDIHGRKLLLAEGRSLLIVAELQGDHARLLAAMGATLELPMTHPMVQKHLASDPKVLESLRKAYSKVFDGTGVGDAEAVIPDVLGQTWNMFRDNPALNKWFLWTDANGDGLQQEAEMKFFSDADTGGMPFGTGEWRYACAPDMTLYMMLTANKVTKVWRWPLRAWNSVGAPVYDLADAKLIAANQSLWWISSGWADSKGNALTDDSPLRMYAPDGKLLWQYPNRWPGVHGSFTAERPKRGRLIGPCKVIGSADLPGVGEIFCLDSNIGLRFLFTTDGLYVGQLFGDGRGGPETLPDNMPRGTSLNSKSAGGESFGGSFFRHPDTGAFYLEGPVDACREASMVAEVTGLDTVKRLPVMPLPFSEQQSRAAAELLAKRVKLHPEAKAITIAPAKKPVAAAPDWSDFDWANGRFARWNFDGKRSAEATWSFDAQQLLIAFRDVMDETPMINGGNDVTTLFKTGDALEFELRVQPDANDDGILPGDLRLLISVFNGKPVAVLYRYRVPGTVKPVDFSSPVGTTRIDVVKVLENAKIAIDRQADRYAVRAAIPLSELGFQPQPGKKYRGDFGVVYSDRSGQVDELRMYWANPVTSMVKDLFSESAINPGVWGWFTISAK